MTDQQSTALRQPARQSYRWWAALFLLGLLLAGCGDDEAPAETPAAATQPATAAAAAAPTAAPAPTQPVSALATGVITATAAPSAAVLMTVTANGASAVLTPLEVEEEADCAIESNLDLLGYPNLQEEMGCPTAEANFDAIAINEFGEADPTDRFMLWFSREEAIYVLLPDGTYQVHEDTYSEENDQTYPCNPYGGEEDSPPLPRRGFGKLWCSDPELQTVMGPVPREERLCQHSVLQQFEKGRLLACFEDATIRYFRLRDDGTWDLKIQ